MDKVASPWSVPVVVDDIPETGLHVDIEPEPEARAAIAKLAGLRDLPQLSASFDLVRHGAGVAVNGHVRATVGQICVVSLDPIENTVDEPIDLVFALAAVVPAVETTGEVKLEAGREPPEPLIDGRVDLGAVATEFLMLGIDPYPRKPDAKFAAPQAEVEGEHPFAALAALKSRSGKPS